MVVTVGDMDHRAVLTNPIGAWHTLLVFCAKSVEIVDIMSQIFQRVVDAKCSQEGLMARSSPVKTIAMLLLCLFLPCDTALAKPAADLLAPTRAKLDALKACLGASDALATLRKGLLWGWPKPGNLPTLRDATPAPPPPPEYLETLDRDVRACDFALTVQDEEQRRQVLSAVAKDVQIKADDCHKFGMGRKVPVTIKTVRGDKTEHGWQVFYKWSCASLLQPEEVRVPNLTSPANVELPPGVYSIRAEKRAASNQVQSIAPVTVVIGSVASVPLELAIE